MALIVLLVVGCSAERGSLDAPVSVSSQDITPTLSASGTGSLSGVSLVPVKGRTDTPDTAGALWVGLYASAQSPQALRHVAMSYTTTTTYELAGQEPVPLLDAIRDGSVMWVEAPKAEIEYHATPTRLVIDSIRQEPPH